MNTCFVFYEDQEARGMVSNFGPHRLLCSCVADELGGNTESRHLQQQWIQFRPCRGAARLAAALVSDSKRLLDSGTSVFAVFDSDKVREQLGLPAESPDDGIAGELRKRGVSPKVTVVLLVRNTESVLQAALSCLAAEHPGRTANLPKKRPQERDRILNNVADKQRPIRDCIRDRIPSFDSLVRSMVSVLKAPIEAATR